MLELADVFGENFCVANEPIEQSGERIAKVIARAGVCSRRDAEKLIAEGRVALDGETVRSPATRVGEHQTLSIDGRPLAEPERTRLWRYHKPQGLVTTHRDPQGRPHAERPFVPLSGSSSVARALRAAVTWSGAGARNGLRAPAPPWWP